MKNSLFRVAGVAVLAAAALQLMGCNGKGLDAKLDTATEVSYRASIDKAALEMTPEQAAAYNWAVSKLSIAHIQQRYPKQTPRQVVAGEAQRTIEQAQARLAELEPLRAKFDALRAEIDKVSASELSYRRDRDFFGDKTVLTAKVKNAGTLAFSSLDWEAELYVGDGTAPVARARISDRYTGAEQGLKPGKAFSRRFELTSFAFDNGAWHTLEVKQAKAVRVRLRLIPEGARDLGERGYLAGAPYEEIASMRSLLEQARAYLALVKA